MSRIKIMAALAAWATLIGYATAQENTAPAAANTNPPAAAVTPAAQDEQKVFPAATNPALQEKTEVKEPEKAPEQNNPPAPAADKAKTAPAATPAPAAKDTKANTEAEKKKPTPAPTENKTAKPTAKPAEKKGGGGGGGGGGAPAVTNNQEADKKKEDPKQWEKRVLYQCQMENPTQYNNLMQMKKNNPIKYRDEVQKMIGEQQKKVDEFNRLVDNYRKTRNPEIKARIKAQLADAYDRQLKWEKTKIEWLEGELKKHREDYQKQVGKRDHNINDQLEKIVLQRAQQW